MLSRKCQRRWRINRRRVSPALLLEKLRSSSNFGRNWSGSVAVPMNCEDYSILLAICRRCETSRKYFKRSLDEVDNS